MQFKDLTGQRFGRLIVVNVVSMAQSKRTAGKYSDTVWLCHCDCGIEKEVSRGNLRNGSTQSCGCYLNTQGAHSHKHPLWKRWDSMIDRCRNAASHDFKNYGGRGIAVCNRWFSFPLFLEDMEATYFKGATLERRDNDGNYQPDNVRWATQREQSWNQRKTIFVDTPWGRMSRGEASQRSGLSVGTIATRQRDGWSTERIFAPENRRRCHRHDKASSLPRLL